MTSTSTRTKPLIALAFLAASAALWWPLEAQAVRLKEIAAVQGVRTNQLTGYGLVVGLDGTGDQTTQTPFTTQSVQAMLQQMGINMPAGAAMQLKNVAAVLVTASLPAFAQPGQGIDINVSSMGNAKSLRGGTLIATPLKGADGQIYAMAQGNLNRHWRDAGRWGRSRRDGGRGSWRFDWQRVRQSVLRHHGRGSCQPCAGAVRRARFGLAGPA